MMLELRDIYKTYLQGKLEVPVLKNVSLSVNEGEYVAIMGPSGSGKTTLMNIIGCLDSPTSGQYFLEGEDLSQQSDAKMSEVRLRSIGFVFQSFYLLPRQSAAENVALPLLYAGVRRKERLEMAREALERVGLGDRVDFKPTQLSGGQCQRVAIARATVNKPKLLLADEPTGALDTKSGEQIMEIFQRLNSEGVTVVMITHEPEIAAHAQRILHIRDGRLTDAQGNFLSPEEPEPEKEPLPEDVIPAQEFFSGPLPSETDSPEDQEESQSPAEGPEISNPAENPLEIPEPLPVEAPEAPAPESLPVVETEPLPEPEAKTEPEAEELLPSQPVQEESDTKLDAEIAALLDRVSAPSEPIEEEGPEEEESQEPQEAEESQEIQEVQETEAPSETPTLVPRSVKQGAPEQLSFDIWAEPAPAESSEPAAEEAVPTDDLEEHPAEEQMAAEPAPLDGQASWEDLPNVPLHLDIDLAKAFSLEDSSVEQGAFRKPIKVELDGLGWKDPGPKTKDSSRSEEDSQ